MKKAVFLDRDGIINIDYGYVSSWDDFVFVPGVIPALAALRRAGWLLVLTTNQSGIARGMFTPADFLKLTALMQQTLRRQQAEFDGIYYCPHHSQGSVAAFARSCRGRKPEPGMMLQAAVDLNIDLARSIMIGDHAGDLQAAARAGIGRLILAGEHLQEEAPKLPPGTECFADLADFVQKELFYAD